MAWNREPYFGQLWKSLQEKTPKVCIVAGPRGVGKTTMASQIMVKWPGEKTYQTADLPYTQAESWLSGVLDQGRALKSGGLMVLDEVQRISGWAPLVGAFAAGNPDETPKILILCSTWGDSVDMGPLVENSVVLRHPHWDYQECYQRNGCRASLDTQFLKGGFPGALGTRDTSVLEWGSFLRDSLMESVFGKDLLSMFPIQKHEVLRKTFAVACANASEIVSYNRLAEAVPEAGSTNTVARYFKGLENAFLIARLPRWRGDREQVKDSAPKIVIRDNGLATSLLYPTLDSKLIDEAVLNRLKKNFVGAVLVTLVEQMNGKLYYFRDRDVEVDFILQFPGRLVAVQVVTGDIPKANHGLRIFKRRFPEAEMVTVGPFQPKGDIRVKYWIPFFKKPASILAVDDGVPRTRKKERRRSPAPVMRDEVAGALTPQTAGHL